MRSKLVASGSGATTIHVLLTTSQQLPEPALCLSLLAFGNSDHCAGTVNQQRSQVAITALADTQQHRLPMRHGPHAPG